MTMKLYWKPDLANAYLVAEKQPRRDQPIFARVYIKHDMEEFQGWNTQMYVSALWPGNTSVLEERPVSFGGSNHDSFKKARKSAEDIVIRWFKGMGIDGTIEQPEFEKEKLWSLKRTPGATGILTP